jgi:hypothetical protein
MLYTSSEQLEALLMCGGHVVYEAGAGIANWKFAKAAPATCVDAAQYMVNAPYYQSYQSICSANPIVQAAQPEVEDIRWEIPRATFPIDMDADLSDWAGIPFKAQVPFRPCDKIDGAPCAMPFVEFSICKACKPQATWSGPADHSVATAFTWTPEALYVGVKVFDDTHQNPGSGWNGDVIQIMFTNAARAQYDDGASAEIDTPGGFILYNLGMQASDGSYHLHHEASPCTGKCIDMAVARDDENNITTYELIFPARALGRESFEMGFEFGLGLGINDGDTGPGQAGQGGWSSPNTPYGLFFGGKQAENNGLASFVGAGWRAIAGAFMCLCDSMSKFSLSLWYLSVSLSQTPPVYSCRSDRGPLLYSSRQSWNHTFPEPRHSNGQDGRRMSDGM